MVSSKLAIPLILVISLQSFQSQAFTFISPSSSSSPSVPSLHFRKNHLNHDVTTTQVLPQKRRTYHIELSANKYSKTHTRRYMKGSDETKTSKDSSNEFTLSASAVAADIMQPMNNEGDTQDFKERLESLIKSISSQSEDILPNNALFKVIGAALLITSNTVGASMMVLPELASGPGLMVSSCIIFAVYCINLFSGLVIADVAINQYETSSCEVPSSFKEFADVNLQSESAGTFVAIISMFVNMCVLSFDFVRGGQVLTEILPFHSSMSTFTASMSSTTALSFPVFTSLLDSNIEHLASVVAAMSLLTLVGTQSNETLSKIASICCMTLFISFSGLVIPGLLSIHDPVSTFMASGTSTIGTSSFASSVTTFLPIALMTGVYQNIVPTITKMLDYDRKSTVSAIALGSFIPMLMYISFCFTVIGGGGGGGVTAAALGTGGMFLLGIKTSSLIGSAMAGIMSISAEINNFLEGRGKDVEDAKISNTEYDMERNTNVEEEMLVEQSMDDICLSNPFENGEFSRLPSVAMSVLPPLFAGIYFSGGEGFVGALSLSGSYGTPILYGMIPVILAVTQRKSFFNDERKQDQPEMIQMKSLVTPEQEVGGNKHIAPGGIFGLGLLGIGSLGLIGNQLCTDFSQLF
mmetsp:Transcript_4936/g.6373  ORF Transcript_4936/g.6373 Transcript_4936/m.6373 type:complete len:637 (+) Transcript_4936:178-2088(+)